MGLFSFRLRNKNVVLGLLMVTLLSSCETITSWVNPVVEVATYEWGDEIPPQPQVVLSKELQSLADIHTIFVQNLSGENVEQVKAVLFEEIRKKGRYEIVDILPEYTSGMGVLRLKVEDYSIWETMEGDPAEQALIQKGRMKESEATKILRRNAMVTVSFSFFDAQSGMPLIQNRYTQPFQQIYVGRQEIEARPKKDKEMDRLTSNVVQMIMADFQRGGVQDELNFEAGESTDWFSEEVHDLGNLQIAKANRLAKSGDYDQAIWVWRAVLFNGGEGQPEDIYIKNRASTFYNLGQLYYYKRDYLNAARMYSQANRLQQKLHYAEAWGKSMYAWLNQSETGLSDYQEIQIKPYEPKKKIQTINRLKKIESNPNLLLQPKQLWPLEPRITNRSDQELNGQQEINVRSTESRSFKNFAPQKEEETLKPKAEPAIQAPAPQPEQKRPSSTLIQPVDG